MNKGDSHDLSFIVPFQGALMGVGLILTTNDNNTKVTWTFSGEDLPVSMQTTASSAFGPTNTGSGSGGVGSRLMISSSLALHLGMTALVVLHSLVI